MSIEWPTLGMMPVVISLVVSEATAQQDQPQNNPKCIS